jgi:hypothetical protein
MGNKKSTSNNVLYEWFIDLNKNPLIISRFDLVELSELHKYIFEVYTNLNFEVYDLLNNNPDYKEEWARNNYRIYGCNLNRFDYLLNLIKEHFDILNNTNKQPQQTNITKKDIFKDDIETNEIFFNYILENTSYKIGRRFLSDLYYNLKPKYIDCKKYEFAKYWNSLNHDYKIGIFKRNAVGLDNFDYEISKEFKTLETKYFKK